MIYKITKSNNKEFNGRTIDASIEFISPRFIYLHNIEIEWFRSQGSHVYCTEDAKQVIASLMKDNFEDYGYVTISKFD